MGRKSERENRRREIIAAFGRVLADHGFAGATMTAVAENAGLSPGLLHHHFKDKNEMLDELLTVLIGGFKKRFSEFCKDKPAEHKLEYYIDAALKLDQNSDLISAKCWVGLLAEALRNPVLFSRVKRHLENEVKIVSEISGNKLSEQKSSAIISFIFGALVFGAFAPRKAAGFAAPAAKRLAKT